MSDLAAKRMEARRRRILENSENRLKKISGLCSLSKESEVQSENIASWNTLDTEALPAESERVSSDTAYSEKSDETKSEEFPKELSKKSPYRNVHSYMESPPAPEDVPITENSLWQEMSDSPSIPQLSQESKQLPLIDVIIKLRLHIIALAIVIRVLLPLQCNFLFFESAFVPLLTLEVADFLSVKWNSSEKQSVGASGLLGAVLVLSGMPAKTVSNLLNTLAIVNQFFQDFCIYFFAFSLTHASLQAFS